MKKWFMAVLAVLGFAIATPASAAVTFNFQAQAGVGLQASGQLTCASNLDASNSCIVTTIAGTVTMTGVNGGNPFTIQGLSSYNSPDQRVYRLTDVGHPLGGDFNLAGLSFTTSSVSDPLLPTFNLFSLGVSPGQTADIRITHDLLPGGGFGKAGTPTAFSLTDVNAGGAVPEPATWAMMIFGFGLVGATLRSTRRKHDSPTNTVARLA